MMNKYLLFLTLSLSTLTFTHCAKDDKVSIEEQTGEYIIFNVHVDNILGFEDLNDSPQKLASIHQHKKGENSEKVESQNGIFHYVDYSHQTKQNTKFYLEKLASTTPLQFNNGVKYLTLIYKYPKDRPTDLILQGVGMGEVDHSNSNPSKVRIQRPEYTPTEADVKYHYRVVSYTFNANDVNDFPSVASLQEKIGTHYAPELTIPTDKEFLYHNSTYDNFGYNDYSTTKNIGISITFKPVTAKFDIGFNASTFSAKVKTLKGNITLDKYTPVKISLTDGAISNLDEISVVRNLDFEADTSKKMYPLEQVNFPTYLYLEDETSLANLTVNVNSLELVDKAFKERQKTTQTLKYSFNSMTLKNKFKVTPTVYFLEAFQHDGLLWSRGNLYYDAKSDFKFKFRMNAWDGDVNLETDYWSFNQLKPNTNSGIAQNQGDPCSQVLPLGLWRMPTEAQFKSLIDKNVVSELKGTTDAGQQSGYNRVTYNATQTTPSIEFYYFGRYDESKKRSHHYDGTVVKNEAHYWVQESSNKKYFYTSNTLKSAMSAAISSHLTEFNNIRCVRDMSTL